MNLETKQNNGGRKKENLPSDAMSVIYRENLALIQSLINSYSSTTYVTTLIKIVESQICNIIVLSTSRV